MSDIYIRVEGCAGRITLQRPEAINALTYDMCLQIEAALDDWRDDPNVSVVVIDAQGDKAFCAGGDLAEMYRTGCAADYSYGRRFWADEYRLNLKIANYPKPYVAMLQGFTMGGGVGVSCHGSHRVMCENSRIAMPECAVGLIPDVGGSYLLARAPGHVGAYMGAVGHRMDAADAIYAGFADMFIPREAWSSVITELQDSGDVSVLAQFTEDPGLPSVISMKADIDEIFATRSAQDLAKTLAETDTEFARATQKALSKQSPLSVGCALASIHDAKAHMDLHVALKAEFRFTYRCMEHGDFIEGIRAIIIEKDFAPKWRHGALSDVTNADVGALLAPLGSDELDILGEQT